MIELRDYQEEAIYQMINSDHDRMVVCLPTGAGKTIVFSAYTAAMVSMGKSVAIAVNRKELLNQTANSLAKMGIHAGIINAKSKGLRLCSAYIMMVETIARRKSHLEVLRQNCDVLIVDECHIGNFNKILDDFKKVIGFSATPMSNKKTIPLAKYYQNIYTPVQVQQLIDRSYLVDANTYGPNTGITNTSFQIKKSTGDYDEAEMGKILSQAKHLDNCVKYAQKFGSNKRVIVYNANIEHSLAVTNAMKEQGLNAYHVDGTTPDYQRKQILMNLFEQPDAIVNNVGILTFGFDCPEVETIILNRATTSLPLYLQMCGRGSRLSNKVLKDKFTIVDLCNNNFIHGLWQDDQDWDTLFHKSTKEKKDAAPTKSCPECDGVIHARVMLCPHCGHIFEKKEVEYDPIAVDLILVKKLKENVTKIMEKVNERGQSAYRGLHLIKERIFKENQDKSLDKMIEIFLEVLPVWCKENGKRNNQWHKDFCKNEMIKYYNQITNEGNSI